MKPPKKCKTHWRTPHLKFLLAHFSVFKQYHQSAMDFETERAKLRFCFPIYLKKIKFRKTIFLLMFWNLLCFSFFKFVNEYKNRNLLKFLLTTHAEKFHPNLTIFVLRFLNFLNFYCYFNFKKNYVFDHAHFLNLVKF